MNTSDKDSLTSVNSGLMVDCSTAELLAADGSETSVLLRRFSPLLRVLCGTDADADDDAAGESDLFDELFLSLRPDSSLDRFLTGF